MPANPAIHFVKVSYDEIEFDNAGVPAILAYRNQGDLFANLTYVVDQMPEDAAFDTQALKEVLRRHQVLWVVVGFGNVWFEAPCFTVSLRARAAQGVFARPEIPYGWYGRANGCLFSLCSFHLSAIGAPGLFIFGSHRLYKVRNLSRASRFTGFLL